ncbi:TIGR01906 family membrane protein [Arthrobacter sp. Hz1]
MAENDETEQRTGAAPAEETPSGASRLQTESAGGAVTQPAGGAAEPAIAQRSSLPMRKASTMPDLSRFDATRRSDPASGTVPAGTAGSATAEPGVSEPAVSGAPAAEAFVAEPAASAAPSAATSGSGASDADQSTGTPAAADPAVPDPPAAAATAATARATTTASAAAAAGSGSGRRAAGEPPASPSPHDPAPDTAALSARPSEEEARRRAVERDEAFTGKPVLARVFQVLIAVFFPIMLLAAAIRAVTSPLFLWVEYHRPGFPADSFGFSTDDRMTYGSYTVDYILNWASPRYLGDLVNADGDQLFLDSEVGHMLDVKLVLVISFAVALAMLVFTLAACWHLARTYPGGVRRALFAGALTTLVLMVALTVTAIFGWQTFFTQVHAVFFADGTWTFRTDDTLIRLFPEQFWTDAAITVAVLVVIVTVLTLVLTWPTKRRREKSRLADDAARQRRLDSLAL